MTLDEKVGQLVQYPGYSEDRAQAIREGKIGSFLNVPGAENSNQVQRIAVEESRLGIPLIFGLDVIHGFRTIFPIPLATASSWDPELVTAIEAIAAREARASGVHWTFAPMVDIARDARWGRISEGAGEDPYLGSAMAAARVRGFQGDDLTAADRIMACLKHYVAYGQPVGGRDYNSVDMSERSLREIYLPPFKAGADAGAASLMSAFNLLNGVPTTANKFTLNQILRGEWGFEGFIVSDWNSVGELVQHGYAGDAADAARLALNATIDLDMASGIYDGQLADLVRANVIPEELLDQSVRRVLRAKFMLGLFDNPYVDPETETAAILRDDHVAAARDAARKSMVLLKNDGALLPLSEDIGSIAVIGPLADNQVDLLGSWHAMGQPEDVVTVLAGIQSRAAPTTTITYAQGSTITGAETDGFAEAVAAARDADVAIVVVGEREYETGEGASRTALDLPGVQPALIEAVHETGTPVVAVIMSGRPLTIPWLAENVPAILQAWHPGIQGGNAVADLLWGDYNPSGKLTASFPRSVGQIPIYYARDITGRPGTDFKYTSRYIDSPDTPLYPFGYGLSYTTFEYGDLTLSADTITVNDTLTVSATVSNTGDVAGAEVVQLYIRDPVASVVRPVKELKGFTKIYLEPGEQQTVQFTLRARELGFFDQEMLWAIEPGVFNVWVGWSSDEGLEGSFVLSGN
ncbi:MAG: glycoside hydrolase family 3 C-terminal domain-containing protein [Gemmatimonadota bacterium]|nr:MAG: glycoside hydrolase family 3 C-terminal domain-containing protein [Gemmatimonadota bacterium]